MFRPSGPHQLTPYCYAQMECAVEQLSDKVIIINTECINDNDKERVYIGETSRSAYTRGKEHLTSLSRKEEGSPLWKHSKEIHEGHVPGFRMSVTGQFRNDAML